MKHQSGRSMVEILGVLAIIGVLSVGGLAAYNYAMDKKFVNDLMYDMELATTEIWTSGTTGPGKLGEKIDVSVLGENHPNITVRKWQHMENGEIFLDEVDGKITEEDVAAVENGEEPAFLIEIHDITVAQCVQLLRNQDKLNTPFLLEDSDGKPFEPEKGDDPQDFCERIFGGDDPVAFGLIPNAYAIPPEDPRLVIPYSSTPSRKVVEDGDDLYFRQCQNDSHCADGEFCDLTRFQCAKSCPDGTEWISTTQGKDEKRGYVWSTSSHGYACHCLVANQRWDVLNQQCVACPTGTEWISTTKGKDEKRGYDWETSWDGYACHCLAANQHWDDKQCVSCPTGTEWITRTKGKGREYATGTYSNNSACHCPEDNPLWDGEKCVRCPTGTDWIAKEEGKKKERGYILTTSWDDYACHCPPKKVWDGKQCVSCPGGTEWITTTKGKEDKWGYVLTTSSNGYACHCPRGEPVWDGEKCVRCPDGTDWITVDEARGKGRERVIGTYSTNGYACHCPDTNPRLDGEKCVRCPDGTKWITKTEAEGEDEDDKWGYAVGSYSNDYACYCPPDKPNWDGKECVSCPTGTKWITTTQGENEKRGYVAGTDSNGYACHCPDTNPVWYLGQCTVCPIGTEWITDEEGEKKEKVSVDGTSSNGYACYHCPDATPVWSRDEKQCTVCPDRTQWISKTQGGNEERDYILSTESHGYACHFCPKGKPVWNETMRQCSACKEEWKISDGKGGCCDFNTGKGCKCTIDYLRNRAQYSVGKGDLSEDQLINGMGPCVGPFFNSSDQYIEDEKSGEVYVAQYMEGTCPNQDFVKVCDANCSYPYLREREFGYCPCGENQVWNSEQRVCQTKCDAGYVLNAAKTACEPIECKEYEIWQVNSDGITECVPCGDSYPVSDDNNRCTTCLSKYGTEKPYWDKDAKQCKPCPEKTPKWNGSSCEPCPEGTFFDSGECIADPYTCPEGYYWNGNCCWNPEGWCEY